MVANRIINDPRPIQCVWEVFTKSYAWTVGTDGVTAIVPYQEPGQGAMVTWMAVYAGDTIVARMPAAAMGIYYGGLDDGAT